MLQTISERFSNFALSSAMEIPDCKTQKNRNDNKQHYNVANNVILFVVISIFCVLSPVSTTRVDGPS